MYLRKNVTCWFLITFVRTTFSVRLMPGCTLLFFRRHKHFHARSLGVKLKHARVFAHKMVVSEESLNREFEVILSYTIRYLILGMSNIIT
jgi:hypothetical protein